MATLTHWKKLSNPNYLGAYSIEDGKDLVLTISNVRQEEIIGLDGKKEECIVCYFSDADKPMVLNSTNAKTIQKLFATPYIEQWVGRKIQIGVEKVRAFGDVVEALRVRKFIPGKVVILCERCGKEITAANGMNAQQIAAYSQKKTGKRYCVACAKEVLAASEKQNAASHEA